MLVKHPSLPRPYGMRDIYQILFNEAVEMHGLQEQYLLKPVKGYQCRMCKTVYNSTRTFNLHCQDSSLRRPCYKRLPKLIRAPIRQYETICGRIIPKDKVYSPILHVVKKLEAKQVSDDDDCAPLLPPDYINSPDVSADETEGIVQHIDISKAREHYKQLSKKKKSIKTHRRYVYGALYKTILSVKVLYLQSDQEPIDLHIKTADGIYSVLSIRHVPNQETALLESALNICKKLPRGGTCRNKSGDIGTMHAFGLRYASKPDQYKRTSGFKTELSTFMVNFEKWLRMNLPEYINEMTSWPPTTIFGSETSLPPTVFASRNLGNSSHIDHADNSSTVGIFVEEKPGMSRNWNFILPNVSIDGCEGVVISLSHGAVLKWKGDIIRHCTQVTELMDGNNVYGIATCHCH